MAALFLFVEVYIFNEVFPIILLQIPTLSFRHRIDGQSPRRTIYCLSPQVDLYFIFYAVVVNACVGRDSIFEFVNSILFILI